MARRSLRGGGMASLLIIVGVVLAVIPEPATSGLGLALIVLGVLLWLL